MNWRDLQVWKKSHLLTKQIYQITRGFPKEERYGLTSQIQRAAYSVPLNIVEGHSRKTAREFLQYLNIARGSLEELRYLLMLGCEIDYISIPDRENLESAAAEVCIMLDALIKSLQRGKANRRKVEISKS
ncbi:MAG: four helix bundle protein [Acidobacteria bacterium]|nr:four helix bundle protein [Acidobacteriota bacterium]MBU4307904.1 four helix bundle protein [Acidobacteriota bacterium]MBU4405917.1 four helix bundle protein [Acidobacteriota bacterium]MCG2811042.1 four helix bundle protein [Candidatus Aminicenantes bacterium]